MITAETIGRIRRMRGHGIPIVSMYAHVPVDPGDRSGLLSRVNSMADEVNPMAKDRSMERAARLSVRADLERFRETVRSDYWQPGAVAMFSCSGKGLFEAVQLPHAVRDRLVVDHTAWTRPMLAVLEEYARCCVAVVDRASALVWELFADEIEEARAIADRALRSPNFAGNRLENRVHHKVQELAKRHYRRTAGELAELFDADDYDLLAVGGHRDEIPQFLDTLSRELRQRVAGTFTVDPNTVTLGELRQDATEIVARYERDIDVRLVGELLAKVATEGQATLGVANCLRACSVKGVATQLIQDAAMVDGLVCDSCGWLGLSGDECPVCGDAVSQTEDILDELAQCVIDEGGSVRHVKADTEVKEHLAAAELRFPLPPLP
ncbi:baeRF10 domain-containing protein [Nocardia sp. Marseille-Q1738]